MEARSPDLLGQATLPPRRAKAARVRVGAVAFAASGIAFVLYPAIRPFSDEASLQAAAAFASSAWLVAHMLGMIGFTLIPIGLLGLDTAVRGTSAERLSFSTLVVSLIGTGLTLPYYGGEAYGLHAIGQEALKQHSVALVALANDVRFGAGVVMFGAGLTSLAVGAIMAAIVVWRSGLFWKWSGAPFALAFVLYVPQFFGAQPLRVAHGLLVAAGCLWLAAGLWQVSRRSTA